jgi:hypothetical protein
MEVVSELKAEDFLEKEGFPVVERAFSKNLSELENAIRKVGPPFIMKVSGEKILKKKVLRGIKVDIKTYTQAVIEFKDLRRIGGSNGVIIQKKLSGKEFLAGIKCTNEFGHSLFFGNIEENFVFRIPPIGKDEIQRMIKESAAFLPKEDDETITQLMLRLSELSQKHPEIMDAKIKFMVTEEKLPKIIDAQISFK